MYLSYKTSLVKTLIMKGNDEQINYPQKSLIHKEYKLGLK
jgi:hypothetical protein